MKKLIIVLALFVAFLAFANASAQVTRAEVKFKTGSFPVWTAADQDSAETQTGLTTAYDVSLWKTLYFAALYDGGTNDSVRVIIYTKFNAVLTAIPIDTLFLLSDTKYLVAASLSPVAIGYIYPVIMSYNDPTGEGDNGDVTDGGTVTFAVFGTDPWQIPDKKSWHNKTMGDN